jgi:hypothetical protein
MLAKVGKFLGLSLACLLIMLWISCSSRFAQRVS